MCLFIRTGQSTKGSNTTLADWTCFIPSSHASLYTEREQIFCHLRLCWHVCCFDSPEVEDGSALTTSQKHLLLSVLSNAIWVLEISSFWKESTEIQSCPFMENLCRFSSGGLVNAEMPWRIVTMNTLGKFWVWIHLQGYPNGMCFSAPFSCWQSLIPLLCN